MPKLAKMEEATKTLASFNAKDWRTTSLGEVCSLINRGISPKYLESGGICVLNQRCIRNHEIDWTPSRRHDDQNKRVASDRHLQVGDGLINSTGTGTLGRVAQVHELLEEPATVDSHVTIVRPTPGVLYPEFFGYMLIEIEDQLQNSGEGCGGQTELPRSTVADKFTVRFPSSLKEQKRIVAILDEAFEGIAKARSNTAKNLQKSIAVFNSQLISIFSHPRIQVALSELATDISDGDHAPPPKASSGIPFITISNIVKETRTIDFRDTFSVPKEYFDKLKPHRKPRKGDILYTVTGATLGIPVYVDHETEFCFQRHIGLIRPRRNVDSLWLSYAMLSPQVFKQATDGATGAAQKTVSLSILRNVRVPRLSLTEQQDISQQLANLEKQAHRLAAVYSHKLVALEELKQSLLLQAFSGNL